MKLYGLILASTLVSSVINAGIVHVPSDQQTVQVDINTADNVHESQVHGSLSSAILDSTKNQDQRKVKVRDGFRGIRWGAGIWDESSGICKLFSEFNAEYCDPDSWANKVGIEKVYEGRKSFSSSVDSLAGVNVLCFIKFYNGMFYGVDITDMSTTAKGDRLLEALIKVYGQPTSQGEVTEHQGDHSYMLYEWDEETTYRSFSTREKWKTDSGVEYFSCKLEMYSKEIAKQIEEDEKKEMEERRKQDSIARENAIDDF